MTSIQHKFYHMTLLAVIAVLFLWSAINPKSYFIWFLEVAPVLIAIPVMAYTYHSFRLTNLAYFLIFIHCIVLIVGGHYTYEHVPLFNWLRDEFALSRNNYDKVGHFMQGFVPAIVIRELLLRRTTLQSGKMLFAIIVLSCLGISALYEIIEWAVAISTGEAADAFLGTQGDEWDTQTDMLFAFIGALCMQIFLARLHNKQLKNIHNID